jgi:hypothetical protein
MVSGGENFMSKAKKKTLFSLESAGITGIGLVSGLLLMAFYQNFDNTPKIGKRTPSSISAPEPNDNELADETVTLTESNSILPSITETVGSVEDLHLRGGGEKLEALPSISMPLSHMKSMGIVSGQKLEVEVNGASQAVYAYSQSADSNVYINTAAAKDLGAKIGDKMIVRQLSEAPPRIVEKKYNDWLTE